MTTTYPRRTASPPSQLWPSSDKQLGYIGRLAAERDLPADQAERLSAICERADADHPDPCHEGGTYTHRVLIMSKGEGGASEIIDWLTDPRRDDAASSARVLAECGLYRRDERLFVVREFTDQGKKVRFARELVANEHSEADRANGNGEAVKLHAVKAPGMQYQLTRAEAVSLEEVALLGIQFGECVICGHAIETKASVVDRHGIGPVCFRTQSALLAGAA